MLLPRLKSDNSYLRSDAAGVVSGLKEDSAPNLSILAAKEEVLGWMRERAETTPAGDIEWESAEDVVIGRFARDPNHVAVIRSMLLPLGTPPRMR